MSNMYKDIFNRVVLIISRPMSAWNVILNENKKDGNNNDVFRDNYLLKFYYPLLLLSVITSLLHPALSDVIYGSFIHGLVSGLQSAVIIFVSFFAGIFFSAWVLDYLYRRFLGIDEGIFKARVLVAYSLTPVLISSVFVRLLDDFFFMKIFYFYIFVLLWDAAYAYYSIKEEKAVMIFTIFSGLVILFSPVLIENVLKLILPGIV